MGRTTDNTFGTTDGWNERLPFHDDEFEIMGS